MKRFVLLIISLFVLCGCHKAEPTIDDFLFLELKDWGMYWNDETAQVLSVPYTTDTGVTINQTPYVLTVFIRAVSEYGEPLAIADIQTEEGKAASYVVTENGEMMNVDDAINQGIVVLQQSENEMIIEIAKGYTLHYVFGDTTSSGFIDIGGGAFTNHEEGEVHTMLLLVNNDDPSLFLSQMETPIKTKEN